MNTIDILLGMDKGDLKRPVKDYKVKSLSTAAKQIVKFKYQGLNSEQFRYIQETAIVYSKEGRVASVNKDAMSKLGILEGVIEPNLKDEKLRQHYNCATPSELVELLLLPGEIIDLFEKISEETGLGNNEEIVEDIKNS